MTSLLFINYEYPPVGAGAANATSCFAEMCVRKGISTAVVTSAFKNHRGRVVENGVTVYRLPAFRRRSGQSSLLQMLCFLVSSIVHLRRVVATEQPKGAVVFFSFPCGPVGVLLKRMYGIPFITMLRGGDVPGFEPRIALMHTLLLPLRRMVYAQSSAVVANAPGLQKLAQRADPGYRIEVVPNGVDGKYFSPAPKEIKQPAQYTFLFAGRLCAQKNVTTLLTAFAACAPEKNNLMLVLLGDGPQYVALQHLADTLRIGKHLQWPGWCGKERLRDYYRGADCFVLPSVIEGMSNAVLEAMACGLPVIGGECAGNRELIVEGETGILVNPHDSSGLTNAMMRLAGDRRLSALLGTKGRQRCRTRFSWSALTDALIKIIETATGVSVGGYGNSFDRGLDVAGTGIPTSPVDKKLQGNT